MPARILIAAGGTVGHVAPALAVADALRARGAEVAFAGTPDHIEAELVPARGYPFAPFVVEGFPRRPGRKLVRAVGRALAAPRQCSKIIEAFGPHAVFGAGGYVAGPMIVAARRHRIPCALSEADARLGLANRLAAPLADRVFLAFPVEGRSGGKYVVTGRPVDPAFVETTRSAAREALGFSPDEHVVLAFGGSLGAQPINDALREAYRDGVPDPQRIVLVAGRGKSRPSGVARFDELEFSTDMARLIAAADLVVCRAGGSVAEVAAARRAAILVPWAGAADDHQSLNARPFERAGAARVIADAELSAAGLRSAIEDILGDDDRRKTMAAAMGTLARPEAAATMADELLQLARRAG